MTLIPLHPRHTGDVVMVAVPLGRMKPVAGRWDPPAAHVSGTLAPTVAGTIGLDTQSGAFGQVIRQYHSPDAYAGYTYDGLGRAV